MKEHSCESGTWSARRCIYKRRSGYFLSTQYTVSKDIDPMACRLEGQEIEHIDGADITSEGIFSVPYKYLGMANQLFFLLADKALVGIQK